MNDYFSEIKASHIIFKIPRNSNLILNYINEFMYNSKKSLNLCLIQQNCTFLGKNLGKIEFIGLIEIILKNRIYKNINIGSVYYYLMISNHFFES